MKFLDQSGLQIVQSWIKNSFAKIEQAFGTIDFAGKVSNVTVNSASVPVQGTKDNVYYNDTTNTFIIKQSNNNYYNNWSNRDAWIAPITGLMWQAPIYRDVSTNKTYIFSEKQGKLIACDATDYPANRLSGLCDDIEMVLAAKGVYANKSHTHTIDNVTGLSNKLTTINTALNILGLNQWGAVRVDGILTNSINAAVGGIGNPSKIYIARNINGGGGATYQGIVGLIGTSYYTTWNGTTNPVNKYVHADGTPYYSKYYYLLTDGVVGNVYKYRDDAFVIDSDYSDNSISDGFGADLNLVLNTAYEYTDSVVGSALQKSTTMPEITDNLAITYNGLAFAVRDKSTNTYGSLKYITPARLGVIAAVRQATGGGAGNAITSITIDNNYKNYITWDRGWREPWLTPYYIKQTASGQRLSAIEGRFCVLDFSGSSGMYLGFTSPYTNETLTHHWHGVIFKRHGAPINITRPSFIASNVGSITCNIPQTQIVNGTGFMFDAYVCGDSSTSTMNTLVLNMQALTGTIEFSEG